MVGLPRVFSPLGWWPSDGARILGSAAAASLGAALAASGSILPGTVTGLAGLGLLASALRRQARAERTAAELIERHATVAHRAATRHPVTGLATREPLLAAMAAELRVDEAPRLIGAVRFTDFDRLSAFDPAAANAALKAFADRLVGATHAGHLVAQVDRDSFCIWFRGQPSAELAIAELNAIGYVAGQDLPTGETVLSPCIEVGAARYPDDGDDPAHLILRVLSSLGRPDALDAEGSVLASPPSMEAARDRYQLEQDLAQAIAEEQLGMVFQPVVDLDRGRMIGAEALLRWDHPTRGAVSPAIFVPIIEAMGLSERYGLWVLNTACREAARWRSEGLTGLTVAVNLSAKQMVDPELPAKVRRTLERHGLDPRALELELTETAAMADAGRTGRLFGELRAMGVKIAIDDFGSGYSSLSYLKNLPFDKLKIDREFVTQADERRDSQAICKALIELGRGLGLVVLAEGVETAEEAAALHALGCKVFQGYHFSRPLSGEAFRLAAREGPWRVVSPAIPASPGRVAAAPWFTPTPAAAE